MLRGKRKPCAMQYRFLRRLSAVLGLALIAVSLTGCSSSSGYYRVRRGDTLGRIAQRHGANAKDLARLNRLSKPNLGGWPKTARQALWAPCFSR